METPHELMDDLTGSDISLSNAFRWYGDKERILQFLVHLQKDGFVEVYELIEDTRRQVNDWELNEWFRIVRENGNLTINTAHFFFGFTDKGVDRMG